MSHLAPTESIVTAYIDTRARIIDVLRSLDESNATTPVASCPAWTVADLAAHIAGLPEDVGAGRVEGAGSDAWTAAQVDRHRGESLAELADALEASTAAFDAVLPLIPAPVNSQIVMDTVTHEHDLRAAVGQPGARDSAAVEVGLGYLLNGRAARQPDLIAQLLTSGISQWELMRVLSGRRTAAQITALGLDAAAILAGFAGSPVSAPGDPVE